MTARTTKQQVYRYDILLYQHIELSYVRILGMLNLLVSEVFLTVMFLVLYLNPKCFMMLGKQSLM